MKEIRDALRRRGKPRKVFVIGLDCAAPELIFDRWRADLPNLSFLSDNGISGELQSCIPAITVPAWSSMLSGKDPGQLGIYGFRNRADHSYDNMFIATGNHIREKRVWDYVSEAGKRSIVVGVPQTYPVRPLNGYMVSGLLTPGVESDFTYPSSLKEEVLSIAPDYAVDVRDFRTDDKDWLLRQIWEMTEARFKVIDHLLTSKPWDFFMLMEIGVDRIHHGFWKYHDPGHRHFKPGNPYENAIKDYYIFIDDKIGDWLDMVSEETVILVVSDHGAKRMEGGICINEWLWREGLLNFRENPEPGKIVHFHDLEVDWSRTQAWGSGGYYGRVFINVQGREPQGIVSESDYEGHRNKLAERIQAIPDAEGQLIGTRVFKPEEIYRQVNGVAPDLKVYFGDLRWRSIGSIGHGEVRTHANDTGPDECNHAENGVFILYDPLEPVRAYRQAGIGITDISRIILDQLGI